MQKKFNVFGIDFFNWYGGFLSMVRFATTRLQFDRSLWDEEPVKLGNYTVETGDRIFRCHIPSGEPLTYEKRLASYKELYNFYKDELKDGIMVIHCGTWLFYPEYLERVYSETSNIVDFAKYFEAKDVAYENKLNQTPETMLALNEEGKKLLGGNLL